MEFRRVLFRSDFRGNDRPRKFFRLDALSRLPHGLDEDPDRKSVVEGKRVDLGGRRIIKKIRGNKRCSREWSSDVCSSDLTSGGTTARESSFDSTLSADSLMGWMKI